MYSPSLRLDSPMIDERLPSETLADLRVRSLLRLQNVLHREISLRHNDPNDSCRELIAAADAIYDPLMPKRKFEKPKAFDSFD